MPTSPDSPRATGAGLNEHHEVPVSAPGGSGDVGVQSARPADSIWAHKPWWCQPWSILLTGITVVLASWLPFHRLWISVPIGLAVLAWWLVFLVLVPAAWKRHDA